MNGSFNRTNISHLKPVQSIVYKATDVDVPTAREDRNVLKTLETKSCSTARTDLRIKEIKSPITEAHFLREARFARHSPILRNKIEYASTFSSHRPCLFLLSGDSKMVTSILEGPRLVVLFFCIFGNLLVEDAVTNVVIMGVVVTVVDGNVVLKRVSVFVLENTEVVLSCSVDSPKVNPVSDPDPVDSTVCASVPIVISLAKSFVIPALPERPSICGGVSTPAISRKVGAKSMFKTMSSTLQRHIDALLTSDQERHSDVKLEREAFPFDQAKLSQMVAVVGRVDDVRVVQLAQVFQLLILPADDLRSVIKYLFFDMKNNVGKGKGAQTFAFKVDKKHQSFPRVASTEQCQQDQIEKCTEKHSISLELDLDLPCDPYHNSYDCTVTPERLRTKKQPRTIGNPGVQPDTYTQTSDESSTNAEIPRI
ncbi:hypothetical protein WN51_05833 [Melipona quadrifasciata]|uniref:Uncharacterized protein n=1 Tax=Melipona quadrifasciata TaxID=166423 RepID=A0A0M9A606_9HYME|nr:hypothetical protein WN51_05833 [Melipona quadrifasciata]